MHGRKISVKNVNINNKKFGLPEKFGNVQERLEIPKTLTFQTNDSDEKYEEMVSFVSVVLFVFHFEKILSGDQYSIKILPKDLQIPVYKQFSQFWVYVDGKPTIRNINNALRDAGCRPVPRLRGNEDLDVVDDESKTYIFTWNVEWPNRVRFTKTIL